MRSRFWVIIGTVACALIVLAVAACGGDDDNAKTAAPTGTQTQSNGGGNTSAATQTAKVTAAPTGDNSNGTVAACSVLTTNEVTVAINEPVGDGTPSGDPPEYICEWDSTSAQVSHITVYLTLYTTGTADGANSEYGLLDAGSEAVSGLGEKAHWVSLIDTLEAVKGNYNVEVQVIDLRSGSDDKAEATALATKVLGRLP